MANIAIAYRIYPKVSVVPVHFSQDKFQMVKMCLCFFRDACLDFP
jgi:hypothetical protein